MAAWHDMPGDYGREQINTLADHFVDIDRAALQTEWLAVRESLWLHRAKPLMDIWRPFLKRKGELFPLSCRLVLVYLLLPTNTACCERGFSAVTSIKTRLRNRMKTPLLNALMHIRLNGPSLDDTAAMEKLVRLAFETWNCLPESGQRCPQRSSRKPRPGREKAVKSLRAILAEMEDAAAVPQPAPMAVEEAEPLRQQQMEVVGPFPVHHPDWIVDGHPVFTPVVELPNLDDPTELKDKWIAIKWVGKNRWHWKGGHVLCGTWRCAHYLCKAVLQRG